MPRTIQEQHTEQLQVFREVTNVDHALKQQIVAAVEAPYLETLRDPETCHIVAPVYDVIIDLY